MTWTLGGALAVILAGAAWVAWTMGDSTVTVTEPCLRSEPVFVLEPNTPTVTPSPRATAASPTPTTSLTLVDVLARAGWPAALWNEASSVAWCESRWAPDATSGASFGLFQLAPLWFDYAGVPFEKWPDPVTNAAVALVVYNYDIARGHAPWAQWVCKPQ